MNVTSSRNYTVNVTDSYDHTCSCYQVANIYEHPKCAITAAYVRTAQGTAPNTVAAYTGCNWTITSVNGTIMGGASTDTLTWDAGEASTVTPQVVVGSSKRTNTCTQNVPVYESPDCNIICDPSGCADCDQVTLTVNATGGPGPCTYLWSANETTQSINVTSSGFTA